MFINDRVYWDYVDISSSSYLSFFKNSTHLILIIQILFLLVIRALMIKLFNHDFILTFFYLFQLFGLCSCVTDHLCRFLLFRTTNFKFFNYLLKLTSVNDLFYTLCQLGTVKAGFFIIVLRRNDFASFQIGLLTLLN